MKTIFIFWIPLAITWLMMATEGPILSAVIARLSDAKFNLAAYGVAFSLAILVESPIIMIMSASAAIVDSAYTLKKLFRYTTFLNAIITIIMLVISLPPVFNILGMKIIGLNAEVNRLTHISIVILIPWPAAIGFRRFYQGILIKFNRTRRVAYGTVIRLSTITLSSVILYNFSTLSGAHIGAAALSCAVVLEALVSRIMANKIIKRLKYNMDSPKNDMTYRDINKFYYPLALTSVLTLGAHPIVTFFMGQARMSLESLAVLPVINSFVFIFRSFGLSYQEVIISKLADTETYKQIKKFAFYIAGFVTVTMALISFTPLINIWFGHVIKLSQELTNFTLLPVHILILLPAFAVWISFQRGMLVFSKKTLPVTIATLIELTGIIIVLFVLIKQYNFIGVVAAAFAFILGRVLANFYLHRPVKKVIQVQFAKTKSD